MILEADERYRDKLERVRSASSEPSSSPPEIEECDDLAALRDTQFARLVMERDRYRELAKEAQGRCTELLFENRALKRRLAEIEK
jgi:hypothetical protein